MHSSNWSIKFEIRKQNLKNTFLEEKQLIFINKAVYKTKRNLDSYVVLDP